MENQLTLFAKSQFAKSQFAESLFAQINKLEHVPNAKFQNGNIIEDCNQSSLTTILITNGEIVTSVYGFLETDECSGWKYGKGDRGGIGNLVLLKSSKNSRIPHIGIVIAKYIHSRSRGVKRILIKFVGTGLGTLYVRPNNLICIALNGEFDPDIAEQFGNEWHREDTALSAEENTSLSAEENNLMCFNRFYDFGQALKIPSGPKKIRISLNTFKQILDHSSSTPFIQNNDNGQPCILSHHFIAAIQRELTIYLNTPETQESPANYCCAAHSGIIAEASDICVVLNHQNIEQFRACPGHSCEKYYEKDGGDDHMTCDCGTHFCMRCGFQSSEDTQIYNHMLTECFYNDSNGIHILGIGLDRK